MARSFATTSPRRRRTVLPSDSTTYSHTNKYDLGKLLREDKLRHELQEGPEYESLWARGSKYVRGAGKRPATLFELKVFFGALISALFVGRMAVWYKKVEVRDNNVVMSSRGTSPTARVVFGNVVDENRLDPSTQRMTLGATAEFNQTVLSGIGALPSSNDVRGQLNELGLAPVSTPGRVHAALHGDVSDESSGGAHFPHRTVLLVKPRVLKMRLDELETARQDERKYAQSITQLRRQQNTQKSSQATVEDAIVSADPLSTFKISPPFPAVTANHFEGVPVQHVTLFHEYAAAFADEHDRLGGNATHSGNQTHSESTRTQQQQQQQQPQQPQQQQQVYPVVPQQPSRAIKDIISHPLYWVSRAQSFLLSLHALLEATNNSSQLPDFGPVGTFPRVSPPFPELWDNALGTPKPQDHGGIVGPNSTHRFVSGLERCLEKKASHEPQTAVVSRVWSDYSQLPNKVTLAQAHGLSISVVLGFLEDRAALVDDIVELGMARMQFALTHPPDHVRPTKREHLLCANEPSTFSDDTFWDLSPYLSRFTISSSVARLKHYTSHVEYYLSGGVESPDRPANDNNGVHKTNMLKDDSRALFAAVAGVSESELDGVQVDKEQFLRAFMQEFLSPRG